MEQYEKMYLYRRIVQAKLFIDSHFADDIDINSIAGQSHFSKFHFIRLFKSIYGKTPHNYLIKVRIDNARLLLSNGTSVIETSIMTGFDSPTSFTAVFKKAVGKTPSEFRASVEQRKEVIVLNPLNVVPNCFIETFGLAK